MGHLTETELSGYQKRNLEPDLLLQVAGHLEACEDCRTKLRAMLSTGRSLVELRQSIESHLSSEQLQGFVDGDLDLGARASIEQHIGFCAECAGDVKALRDFANANALVTSARPARPAHLLWWAAIAASVLIAFGVAVWLRRPVVISAVDDSGTRITLDSRGKVGGVRGLSPQQIELVRQSLENAALFPAANLTELQPPGGSLMGARRAAGFQVVAPVGTAVRSSRPELRWAARGAATYVVTLKNIASGQVISSPPLLDLAWTPPDPLQPGAIYAWQVAASVDGSEEVTPSPPSPQARFLVLDSGTTARLGNLPRSHLVRATLYAEAGLLDDAEQEAEALQKENPGSNIAQGLLQRVRALRRTAP